MVHMGTKCLALICDISYHWKAEASYICAVCLDREKM